MVYAEHGFEKKWYCVMCDPDNVTDHSVTCVIFPNLMMETEVWGNTVQVAVRT